MGFIDTLKRIFGIGGGSLKLRPGDRLLVCEDCQEEFVFDVGEQRFFRTKGFTDPKRCPDCRREVKNRLRRRRRGPNHNHRNHQKGNFRMNHMSPYVDER